MKEIKLTQGKVALVDDEDYEWMNQWKWYAAKGKGNSFYAQRIASKINGKRITVLMHRLIMKDCAGLTIDHIDGNGLNCQKYNLRKCTQRENSRNRGACKNSTSRFVGVGWHKHKKKWTAQINPNGICISIGTFSKEEDAAIAYNEYAKKYFGEFARLNIINDKPVN